jgi:hypothetical protein
MLALRSCSRRESFSLSRSWAVVMSGVGAIAEVPEGDAEAALGDGIVAYLG